MKLPGSATAQPDHLLARLLAQQRAGEPGPSAGADGCVYIVSTGRDISERKRHDEERERLIGELRQSMARIKTLHGLIPICAVCKRIRDDRGYWNQIESWKRPSGSPARDSPSPPSTPRYPSAGRSRAVTTSPADTRT